MRMLVMNVWVVRVFVVYGRMPMPMHMRLCHAHAGIVWMLMVFVMGVRMCVRQWLVGVPVFMGLGQMQAHAYCHQSAGHPERRTSSLTEQQ